MPQAVKIQGNRQLQRIERPQALSRSVLNQKFSCSLKMSFMDRRCDYQTLARKVGPEAATGDLKRRLIDLSRPGFDGKHGFEFDD